MKSPVQDVPSPEYPVLHAQVKDPGVLVHVAWAWQLLSSAAAHSLLSVMKEKHECLQLGYSLYQSFF